MPAEAEPVPEKGNTTVVGQEIRLAKTVVYFDTGDKQEYHSLQGIDLPRPVVYLRFELAPASGAAGSPQPFQTRLSGQDSEFSTAQKHLVKEYTNLGPGQYLFEVRFEPGQEEAVTLASFRIPRAWWQSPFMVILVLVVLGGGICALIQWRSQNLEKELAKIKRDLAITSSELERKSIMVARLAVTDELTGLYNRRFILNFLEKELRRLGRARTGDSLAVIRLDIDHMHDINSRWGMKTGDILIQHFARCLKACLRTTDMSARLSGQDFLVLLPQTETHGAARVAEKIRKTIILNPLEKDGQPVTFTVSVGVVVIESPLEFSDELVKEIHLRAEFLLQHAKKHGRNRTTLDQWSSPQSEP
jgi:diguanylate cyclase (GGDEF)-like protein